MLRSFVLLAVVLIGLYPVFSSAQVRGEQERESIVVVDVFYAGTCPCSVKSILRLVERKYPGTIVVTRPLAHGPREEVEENKKMVRELGYDPEKVDLLTVVNHRCGYSFEGVEDYLPKLEALVKMAYLENADQLGKRYVRAHERLDYLRQLRKTRPGITDDINKIRIILDQASSAARRGDRETYEKKVVEAEDYLGKLEGELGLESGGTRVTRGEVSWLLGGGVVALALAVLVLVLVAWITHGKRSRQRGNKN